MGLIMIELHQLVNHSQNENVYYYLAKYLLTNINSIMKLTINKVMEDTLVSKTSILKFCNSLGYHSWKQFRSELQDEVLNEQQYLLRLKMNAKMMFVKEGMKEYQKLKEEYLDEANKRVSLANIEQFAQQIHLTNKILILGNIREVTAFYELQDLLTLKNKAVIFPRYLNKEDLNNQINNIDNDTLIIISDGMHSYNEFITNEVFDPIYNFNENNAINCKKVFIGQQDDRQDIDLLVINLPYSFNEYFVRLAIIDLIYKVITYYSYKYN